MLLPTLFIRKYAGMRDKADRNAAPTFTPNEGKES